MSATPVNASAAATIAIQDGGEKLTVMPSMGASDGSMPITTNTSAANSSSIEPQSNIAENGLPSLHSATNLMI